MNPSRYSIEHIVSGIANIREVRRTVNLIYLQLAIVRLCRILLDDHDDHRAITILSQIDKLASSQHNPLNLMEFVSQIRDSIALTQSL